MGSETWKRFAELKRVFGPTAGVREQWHRGRSSYAVWVLRVSHPAIDARVSQLAAALGAAIRPIPQRDLHVTLFVSGFPTETPSHDDDVAWSVLRAQRELFFAPLRIAVGGSSSFATAAFLEVVDVDGGLADVRAQLAGEGRELRFSPYVPHLTVGTYAQTAPAAPVRSILERWRGESPVLLTISAVELVVFDARVEGAVLETVWRCEASR